MFILLGLERILCRTTQIGRRRQPHGLSDLDQCALQPTILPLEGKTQDDRKSELDHRSSSEKDQG